MSTQSSILDAYIEAVAFTERPDDLDEQAKWDDATFHASFYADAARHCAVFAIAAEKRGLGELLAAHPEQAGHDLWLTRNGHGAGFWDRPEIWGEHKDTLTDLAEAQGEIYAYTGDDGHIYFG